MASLPCPLAPFLHAPPPLRRLTLSLSSSVVTSFQGTLHCRPKQAGGEVTLAERSLVLEISTALAHRSRGRLSLWHGHFVSLTDSSLLQPEERGRLT